MPDNVPLASAIPGLVLAVLALGVASALTHARHRRVAAVLKMGAATGYLVLAVSGGALDSSYGRVLLTGLTLCWLGDLLLVPAGSGAAFLGGLSAFLLGHVAYALAFVAAGVSWPWAGVAALPAVLVGGGVLRWLWGAPLPGAMKGPVIAYVGAISFMVALAFGALGSSSTWLVPAGAVAFMASDVFVARERFVTATPWNTRVGLPLYFLAQTLFALTV